MIVVCNNCNKKFDIDAGLIPDNGRLLQCGSCNHKWFFKKATIQKFIDPIKNENFEVFEPTKIEDNKLKDKVLL